MAPVKPLSWVFSLSLAVSAASASPGHSAEPTAPAPQAAPSQTRTVELKDLSLDKPLVLDENVDYRLKNVTVSGVFDCAALTLAGRINSILLDHCTFGKVWSGDEGKAAGLECAGAWVKTLTATHTTFFDAENQLATFKDGSFGRVRFEHCRFSTSEEFLKRLYAAAPWRDWTPSTEFYNIDRLELLDNTFSNTTVIIHPSVRQVIIRGDMPGLQVINPQSTQLIQLQPGQLAESIAPLPAATIASTATPAPHKG